MIGRLLGHMQVETTARYAYLAKHSLRETEVGIFESIAGDLRILRASCRLRHQVVASSVHCSVFVASPVVRVQFPQSGKKDTVHIIQAFR